MEASPHKVAPMVAPAVDIQHLFRQAADLDASDLHICAGRPPQARVFGELRDLGEEPLSGRDCESLIDQMLTPAQWDSLRRERELDFSHHMSDLGRFRVNVYFERGNCAAALRRIRATIPSFAELGLPEKTMQRLADLHDGMVLITGPTGSGKSTTLAAILDYINSRRGCRVVTIEDPIEFVHQHRKATIVQREVGDDTLSFSKALRRVLREDPDVVVVGEMRDLETISVALRVAETGHLVLSTLHTGTTSHAISRMIDVFPLGERRQIETQISLSLQAVVAQQLLPRSDGEGRALATEIMVVTPAIRNLVREGELAQIYSHIQMGSAFGMQTMNASLAELVVRGAINTETAIAGSPNEKELLRLLHGSAGSMPAAAAVAEVRL